MTTTTIKKLARKYSDKITGKNSEAKLKNILREIFDVIPGLTHIEVVGYTPSFNDGDPCTHDQYLTDQNDQQHILIKDEKTQIVNLPDYLYDFMENSDEAESLFECTLQEIFTHPAVIANGWAPYSLVETNKEDRISINKIISSRKVSLLCEDIYGTNFGLLIYPKEDSVEIIRCDYDCGW
jgi:hypothetical protein